MHTSEVPDLPTNKEHIHFNGLFNILWNFSWVHVDLMTTTLLPDSWVVSLSIHHISLSDMLPTAKHPSIRHNINRLQNSRLTRVLQRLGFFCTLCESNFICKVNLSLGNFSHPQWLRAALVSAQSVHFSLSLFDASELVVA